MIAQQLTYRKRRAPGSTNQTHAFHLNHPFHFYRVPQEAQFLELRCALGTRLREFWEAISILFYLRYHVTTCRFVAYAATIKMMILWEEVTNDVFFQESPA